MAESRDDDNSMGASIGHRSTGQRYQFYVGDFHIDNYVKNKDRHHSSLSEEDGMNEKLFTESTLKTESTKAISESSHLQILSHRVSKDTEEETCASSSVTTRDEERDKKEEVLSLVSTDCVEDEELKEMIRFNLHEQEMLVFSPTEGKKPKSKVAGDNETSETKRTPNLRENSSTNEAGKFLLLSPVYKNYLQYGAIEEDPSYESTDAGSIGEVRRSLSDFEVGTTPQGEVLSQINTPVASEDEDDGLSKELRCLASAEDELRKELGRAASSKNTQRGYDCSSYQGEENRGGYTNRKQSTFNAFLSDVVDYVDYACRSDLFSCVSWDDTESRKE